MKVKVGYITSWRRMIFFALIFSIILFGSASTICQSNIGPGIVTNLISVFVLLLCIAGFLFVLGDPRGHYEGTGTFDISDGRFVYHDKKRHLDIELSAIEKVDMQKITTGNNGKVLAYRILLRTAGKKYYIESERARGLREDEVDLNRLYLFLREKLAE